MLGTEGVCVASEYGIISVLPRHGGHFYGIRCFMHASLHLCSSCERTVSRTSNSLVFLAAGNSVMLQFLRTWRLAAASGCPQRVFMSCARIHSRTTPAAHPRRRAKSSALSAFAQRMRCNVLGDTEQPRGCRAPAHAGAALLDEQEGRRR